MKHCYAVVVVMKALLMMVICGLVSTQKSGKVRVCVAGREATASCRKMESLKKEIPISCYVTQDKYDCLLRLVTKEADVALAGPEDVFLAKEILEGKVHVIGQTRTLERENEVNRYDGVAVVRKSTISGLDDLNGAKSCHTGYRRTAGWHIPIAQLLEKKKLKLPCGRGFIPDEQDLMAMSNFFGLACVPGRWAPDNTTNSALKARYPNLCSMCGSPGDCGEEDTHAGYQGALDCLTKGNGDVAWTKFDAVASYFNSSEKKALGDSFLLLCPDGTLRPLSQPCPWASKPWDAWLTRANHENTEAITKSLRQALEAATIGDSRSSFKVEDWASTVLGVKSPSVMKPFSPPITPYKYLSIAAYDVTIERLTCPSEPVRLCVESDQALDKCNALTQVLRSRRVQPDLSCVSKSSSDADCLETVAQARADIATADGADVYRGQQEHQLTSLVAEKYGQEKSAYYAVAVVKKSSGIQNLRDLAGKKSCHTGINKTAGWKIPIVALLEAGLIRRGACNYAHELGGIFSASCVPGAKSSKYDPMGTNPQSLCELCVGKSVEGADGPSYSVAGAVDRCSRSPNEAYYGYSGAFRCLVEGGGDVAFVKHTTVGENINPRGNMSSWAEGFTAQDFRLLCRGGGSADIVDFQKCNLAQVPSHKVLMKRSVSDKRKEEIRILLLSASAQFPKGQNNFVLFGPFHGHNDIIFKDSATQLINLPDDSFHNSVDESYYRMLKELETCVPDPNLHDDVYSKGEYDASAQPYPYPGVEMENIPSKGTATLVSVYTILSVLILPMIR